MGNHNREGAKATFTSSINTRNMKTYLALLLSVAVAAAGEDTAPDYDSLWMKWTAKHQKQYHPHEVMSKYKVFKDNYDLITDHNTAKKHSYTLALNEFADLTRAEFGRQFLGLNALQAAPTTDVAPLLESSSSVPSSIDWVAKGAVTGVKNQGQCGGCWAFSTTGAVEGINYITTGKLVSLSEQELVSCASSYGNQGCNGGLMTDGFDYLKDKGDSSEADYPYTSSGGTAPSCSSAKQGLNGISKGAITGHVNVQANSEAALQSAVSQQPVSVAIEADQSAFQFYSSGVFDSTCGSNVDHGVLLVGYGTDGGQDYWKVKNSWGTTWGEDGYIRMVRNVDSSSGQCGIASMASYPTMNAALQSATAAAKLEGDHEDSWTSTVEPLSVATTPAHAIEKK